MASKLNNSKSLSSVLKMFSEVFSGLKVSENLSSGQSAWAFVVKAFWIKGTAFNKFKVLSISFQSIKPSGFLLYFNLIA